jgi:hypothetical protein
LPDFADGAYIRELIALSVGFEIALATRVSVDPRRDRIAADLRCLDHELAEINSQLVQQRVPLSTVRVHQPGGYFYDWAIGDGDLPWLAVYLDMACQRSFIQHVIHAPVGNLRLTEAEELVQYRQRLSALSSGLSVEVEEVPASHAEMGPGRRYYVGRLFEALLADLAPSPLIDTHESGGIDGALQRAADLASKGFRVNTLHCHRDKHQLLRTYEYECLRAQFTGTIVNEGFIRDSSTFAQFLTTGSLDCVASHEERVAILRSYQNIDATPAVANHLVHSTKRDGE